MPVSCSHALDAPTEAKPGAEAKPATSGGAEQLSSELEKGKKSKRTKAFVHIAEG